MNRTVIIIFAVFASLCSNAQVYYYTPVQLYTPNGTPVYAREKQEMSDYNLYYYTYVWVTQYLQAIVLAPATSKYNCHSYTFNMTEGGVVCWLDDDIQKYWKDGSYEETTANYAEKIHYYEDDHSAVPSSTHPGMYESKWGDFPLMRHAPEDAPADYNVQYRHYYRKVCERNVTNQSYTDAVLQINGCCNVEISDTELNNSTMTVKSSTQIRLLPGFHAKAGSHFHAKIESCNTGSSSSPSLVKGNNSYFSDNNAENDEKNITETPKQTTSDKNLYYHNNTIYNTENQIFTLYNIFGSAILTSKETAVNVSNLISGVYIVKTEKGKVLKFVR